MCCVQPSRQFRITHTHSTQFHFLIPIGISPSLYVNYIVTLLVVRAYKTQNGIHRTPTRFAILSVLVPTNLHPSQLWAVDAPWEMRTQHTRRTKLHTYSHTRTWNIRYLRVHFILKGKPNHHIYGLVFPNAKDNNFSLSRYILDDNFVCSFLIFSHVYHLYMYMI